MCCLCFKRVTPDLLHVNARGQREDVCITCAEAEASKARLCVVCGARVCNINPSVVTCDNTCTQARKAGISRPGQLRLEMYQDKITDRYWLEWDQRIEKRVIDSIQNTNQP